MSDGPFRGAFRHQHGEPQTLIERIEAQIRERIEEAVEMAGLEVLVELRRRENRPPPEEDSARDREEFLAMAESLLTFLDDAFRADQPEALAPTTSAADAADAVRARRLTGQVALARRLPDYWQRFEAYRVAFASRRLGAATQSRGWLRRLFGS